MWTRRELLKAGVASAGLMALGGISGGVVLGQSEEASLKEVMFYEKQAGNKVKCLICPRACSSIPEGLRGYCGNKENQKGSFYNLAYAKVCSLNIDPIEKKPLYHFLPGTGAFSLATAGCNFKCNYCQNWQISQATPEGIRYFYWPPEKVVKECQDKKVKTIAFTYSEPIVFYTYMYDTAQLAKAKGINSVMISNGSINEKPLRELCKQLTAVKIDLKGFREDFYRKICHGQLKPVLDTLLTLKDIGIWFEIVVLLIPTLNDSKQELTEMCKWINRNLGPDVPVHFSRFRPMYKLTNLPPTPVKTLEQAWQIALDCGIKFVYLGNVAGHPAESTICPSCKKTIIKRIGYKIQEGHIKSGKCGYCQAVIPGVWSFTERAEK